MRFEREPLDFTVHKDMPWNHIKKQYLKHLAGFIALSWYDRHRDGVRVVGNPEYPLYQKLSEELGVPINQDSTLVWAFDCVESYINPEDFFHRDICKNETVYVTCPYRALVPMWSYNHWAEYSPERFTKLANHHGYAVVNQESHIIWRKWYQYLGFRAITRLFFPYHLGLYKLVKII